MLETPPPRLLPLSESDRIEQLEKEVNGLTRNMFEMQQQVSKLQAIVESLKRIFIKCSYRLFIEVVHRMDNQYSQ